MNLTGNTVLITGGSSGIGLEMAKSLLEMNNEVIICGRSEDRLNEAKARLPKLHVKVCDVADSKQQRMLYDWVTAEFPQINILVNNAGIQKDIDLTKGIEDLLDGESEIKIDFEAPVLLSGLFIPVLAKLEEAAIVNVTSSLAFTPRLNMPIYCAVKAALHTYTFLLRHQLSGTGIKVFEVIPPMVDTGLNPDGRAKQNLTYRGIKSDEYISSVIRGLKNDDYEIYFGESGNTRTTPRSELEYRLL